MDLVVVLERVYGENLGGFLKYGNEELAPSYRDRFKALLGICRGLIYLHSRKPPVVHGDLKDENVLVEHREHGPHAKLLDFGLARILTRAPKPLGGTLIWAAPEVFTVRTPTTAADVLSAGRLIYFVVVLKRPLQDYRREVVVEAYKSGHWLALDWPDHFHPISRECRKLVEKSDMIAPEGRPTMEVLHREVLGWLLGEQQFPRAARDDFWEVVRKTREQVKDGCLPLAKGEKTDRDMDIIACPACGHSFSAHEARLLARGEDTLETESSTWQPRGGANGQGGGGYPAAADAEESIHRAL